MRYRILAAAFLSISFLVWTGAGAHEPEEESFRRQSLRTVEGSVVAISSTPGEGDLPVVTIALQVDGPEAEPLEILLAPAQVLGEIDFAVREGDVLRARVFVSEQAPLKAHKVMNTTRGTMVRFRSLAAIPLWTARGHWEGGPCRQGNRYRGGRR